MSLALADDPQAFSAWQGELETAPMLVTSVHNATRSACGGSELAANGFLRYVFTAVVAEAHLRVYG